MTTYLDNIEKLKQVLDASIPQAPSAKMAILRPTTHFQVLTADNPDMVRTLELQQAYVDSELAKCGELTEIERNEKIKQLKSEFQKPLTDKATQEQNNLLAELKKAGVLTAAMVEDKGKMETSDFDTYTDQIFATDPGQYYVNDENELVFIAGNFKNQQRKGEERLAILQAQNLGAKVQKLEFIPGKPLTFEGGDIRQMPGRKLFFMGHGHRSDSDTSHAVALMSDYYVVPVKLTNEQFYHIDCCFLPLPNDAAVIYEGDYETDEHGIRLLIVILANILTALAGILGLNYLIDRQAFFAAMSVKDENGWPKIKAGTETMTASGRALIRAIYPPEKLVLISHKEALAYATNAAILESKTDHRFKLFVNGDRSTEITDEQQALAAQQISFTSAHIEEMKRVTAGLMDVIEVPYRTIQYSGGSVRCTIQEVACNWAHLEKKKGYFSASVDKLEENSFVEKAAAKWRQQPMSPASLSLSTQGLLAPVRADARVEELQEIESSAEVRTTVNI